MSEFNIRVSRDKGLTWTEPVPAPNQELVETVARAIALSDGHSDGFWEVYKTAAQAALTAIEAARPKKDGLLEALKGLVAEVSYFAPEGSPYTGLIKALNQARAAIATQGE